MNTATKRTFDSGVPEPQPIDLPCGSIAYFDTGSGFSYRCDTCNATVGSIGMPRECKKLFEMEDVVKKLKGKPV